MVTIPWAVTIQLQPFLLYMNLALKNSYQKGIWLSNIITGHLFQAEKIIPLYFLLVEAPIEAYVNMEYPVKSLTKNQ